jgi:hypothetical protein
MNLEGKSTFVKCSECIHHVDGAGTIICRECKRDCEGLGCYEGIREMIIDG